MYNILDSEKEALQDAAQRPRIRFSTTEKYFTRQGEINNDPSETVPDQSMSLTELLHRHTKGQPVSVHEPIYLGEEPLPDLSKLDLTEVAELHTAARRHTDSLREQYEQAQLAERATFAEHEKKRADKTAAERLPPADTGIEPIPNQL